MQDKDYTYAQPGVSMNTASHDVTGGLKVRARKDGEQGKVSFVVLHWGFGLVLWNPTDPDCIWSGVPNHQRKPETSSLGEEIRCNAQLSFSKLPSLNPHHSCQSMIGVSNSMLKA